MSSILNALKKLEKDPPPKDETQIFQQQIDTKRAINKRAKGTWLFRKFATLFIVAVIVVGGGWFAWNQKSALRQKFFPDTDSSEKKAETTASPAAKKEAPPVAAAKTPEKSASSLPRERKMVPPMPEKVVKVQSVKPPKASVLPEHKEEAEEKPAEVPAPSKKMEAEVAKLPKLSGREIKALEKLKRKIEDLDNRKKMDKSFMKEQAEALDVLKKKIAELEQRQGTSKPAVRTPEPAKRPKQENKPDASAKKSSQIREADGANLKIQALVWSDEPADRWVMINNRIIKTGGSVDDIIVSEIGNDHIIIQENGEEKKVKFQLK